MSTTLTKLRAKKTPGVTIAHHVTALAPVKITGSGVVNYYVHGPLKEITNAGFNPSQLIEVVQMGLPMTELTELQASLAVPADKLAPMLGISKATLHRRKAGGRLGQAESDRVVRFARL